MKKTNTFLGLNHSFFISFNLNSITILLNYEIYFINKRYYS